MTASEPKRIFPSRQYTLCILILRRNCLIAPSLLILAMFLTIPSINYATEFLDANYTIKSLEGNDISLFHGTKSTPVVMFIDTDKDGTLDYMQVSVTNALDKPVRDLFDYNFDGKPDSLMEYGDGFYMMHEDKWHKVFFNRKTKVRHIMVNGKKIVLTKENALFLRYHPH